jgi:uncharacterized protein (DUF1015 family)
LAELRPLRGLRYNAEHVHLGGVLAPPYDVISPARREALYGRDLRNIVRIDFGQPYADDVAGRNDVYTRAAEHLRSWRDLGVLVREERPALYLVAHEYSAPDGAPARRLGLLGRVPAVPWERSEVRPHEHTLRGPRQDRLALLRATGAQTSPVWLLWDRAPGLAETLGELARGPGLLGGRIDGEMGSEKLVVWAIQDESVLNRLAAQLAPATLYVADGHHRFETAAAYAAERRAAGDGVEADSQWVLVYACAAGDPGVVVLPTHRLVRPRPGLPRSLDQLWMRLREAGLAEAGWAMEAAADPLAALADLSRRHPGDHTLVAVVPDGTAAAAALLHRPRGAAGSPRASLDVAVLQDEVMGPLGIGEAELSEGALDYTRDPAEAAAAVGDGRAGLAFLVKACTPAQVLAVADAGETMPQKSTYFYPKVPTGLVLSPL